MITLCGWLLLLSITAACIAPSFAFSSPPTFFQHQHVIRKRVTPTTTTPPYRVPLVASQQAQDVDNSGDAIVPWTVANLFWINDTLLNVYHAAGVAWDNLVPVGALVGALTYLTGVYQPYATLAACTGSAAFTTGIYVMAANVAKLFLWDIRQTSMKTRAQALKTDYNMRVMDQSVWLGCALAIVPLLLTTTTTPDLGLADGTNGVLQCLTLGSVVGSCLGWYRQQ